MNQCCQKVISLSPEGEKINKILMALFFIDIILIIVKIIFRWYDSLFSMIISLVLLLSTFLICHYLLAMFVVFFALFDVFYSIVFLSLRLQNWIAKLEDKYLSYGFYKVTVDIEFVYLVYNCVLIFFSFKAYREFKASAMGYKEEYNPLRIDEEKDVESNKNDKTFKPFTGKGIAVGGN